MHNNLINDTHTTDGFAYQTPSHPLVISALGRIIFNFLSLEETVVAILYETNFMTLRESRKLMAGQKLHKLKLLKELLISQNFNIEMIELLGQSISSFEYAIKQIRNAYAHATIFTVGYDEHGAYFPGFSIERIDGLKDKVILFGQLHEDARNIENAGFYLNEFRRRYKELKGK